jgi:hypothetical protein
MHLENLPVPQLLKNFPTFYRTRSLITMFTRALHWPLSRARSIQSHLPLRLPIGPSPSDSPTKILYTYIPHLSMLATSPAHLILIDLIPIMFGEYYKLWNSPFCNFPQPPTISSLFSPNIFLSTLFSNTLSLCSSFIIRGQVSHLYKTRGKIIVLYILIDRLCRLVVRVPGYRIRGPGFDSRRYQFFWEVVGLERSPLSLVRIIEELLGRKAAAPVQKTEINGHGDPLRWPRDTLYPLKLALNSPTSGGRSVGIVRWRTNTWDFSFSFVYSNCYVLTHQARRQKVLTLNGSKHNVLGVKRTTFLIPFCSMKLRQKLRLCNLPLQNIFEMMWDEAAVAY